MGWFRRSKARFMSKELHDGVRGEYGGILLSDLTMEKERGAEFAQIITEALQLIETHDPRRFQRAQRELSYIANSPIHAGAQYMDYIRCCVVDYGRFASQLNEENKEWYAAKCACIIVHEATHGVLHSRHIPYSKATWKRSERLCRREEKLFSMRLRSDAFDFTSLVSAFNPEDWTRSRPRWPWQWAVETVRQARRLWRSGDLLTRDKKKNSG